MVVGIRPEGIVPADSSEAGYAMTITPDRIELLGSDQMIHFPVSGESVVAKWPSDIAVSEGQPLKIKLSEDSLHLFDGASQDRIF
jgi:ABC-type sugar transport system ATPase subunit